MASLIPFNKKNEVSRRHMNPFNMIDDFFGEAFRNFPAVNRSLLSDPFKVDVKEMDNEYVVEAELPGVKKEDINLNLSDEGMLSIAVNRKEETEEKDENNMYLHRERRYDSMKRSLYLAEINPDSKVRAKLENGVLEIKVEKAEQEQIENTRNIEIE